MTDKAKKKSLGVIVVKERETLPTAIIKTDTNLARLPFFALSRKGLKNKKKAEYKYAEEREGRRVELLWQVTANAEYGYPGPFDKKVHKAIEYLIYKQGLPVGEYIKFSFYEICKLMGIANSGKNRKMIRDALMRTSTATIRSQGSFCFLDNGRRKGIERIFGLYDVVFINETLPDSKKPADTNYIFLGKWYRASLNSFYVKPFDYVYYRSLRSDLAGRLYEFLSVQFYALKGRPYQVSYKKLCQLLPIEPQEHFSNAKQNLDPAHAELIRTGFLDGVEWDKQEWTITYYAGERAKKELKRGRELEDKQPELQLEAPNLEPEEKKEEVKAEKEQKGTPLIQKLVKRGITEKIAEELVKKHPPEKINLYWQHYTFQKKKGKAQDTGYFIKSLEENWGLSEEFLEQKKQQIRKKAEEKRKARWLKRREELIEEELAKWEETPPEERVKGRLGLWLQIQKIDGLDPTPEEIRRKEEELVRELPQTEERKRAYIELQYPKDPPEDFK